MKYAGLFADAVDEGLSVLGEIPKRTIYEFLDTQYSMKRNDIPTRFAEFSRVLKDNMGMASDPLLTFILDGFYMKIHADPPKWSNLSEGITTVDRLLRGNVLQEITLSKERTVHQD